MKEVYVVTAGDYSDYHIEGIFTEKEFAEEFISRQSNPTWYSIEPFELDIPKEEWDATTIYMDIDGNVKYIRTQNNVLEKQGLICFDCDLNLVWCVRTKDATKAIKVTNEKRIQILCHDLWNKDEEIRELFGG